MTFSELEKKLGYEFRDKKFLDEACRHSSFVNEHISANLRDNERLEFLGDAVLNLVIGHILMRRYPALPEGDLSRMRASLVNELQLAKIAKAIHLGNYVQLGKGEIQTNGRRKKSILADTLEAIIAAVYLDRGFDAAFRFVESHFSGVITATEATLNDDYKSRLQEVVQVSRRVMPVYRVIEESGPDHDKTFVVLISVGNLQTRGAGKSKKMAEQNAAKKALDMFSAE